MKKIFYSLILIALFLTKSIFALEPDIKLTAQDLGYNDSSSVVYFEKINEDYLAIIVEFIENGRPTLASWAYNIDTKNSISLNYSDSLGIQYVIGLNQFYSSFIEKNPFKRFLIKENKIYNFITDDKEVDDITQKYLLITDLQTQDKKIIPIDACSDDIGFVSTDHHDFFAEMYNCNQDFVLYEFSDTSIHKIWNLKLGEWEFLSQLQRFAPYSFKDKILVSNLSSLYVFDANTYTEEKIINDINISSLSNPDDDIVSSLSQYFEFNDEVYIVYSDISYFYFYVVSYLSGKTGNIRIWKTDGSKSGTSLDQIINTPEEQFAELSHYQFFSLNNNLYWIDGINDENSSSIYKYENSAFKFVGNLDLNPSQIGNRVSKNFGKLYDRANIPFYKKANSFFWKGKHWLPTANYRFDQNGSLEDISLNLLTIEDDKIKVEYMKSPITKDEISLGGGYLNFANISFVQKNEDEIGLFIYGNIFDRPTDINFYTLLYYSFNDLSKEPIDSFRLKFPLSKVQLNQTVKNDELFIFGDSISNQIVLWNIKVNVPTPIKNHTFIQKDLFKLYPNPAAHFITLESPEFLNGQMMIVGIDGKVYQSFNFNGHQKNIDISQLSAGMYRTVFVGDGVSSTNSFVKSE